MRIGQSRISQWAREQELPPAVRQTVFLAGIAVWLVVACSALWGVLLLIRPLG